MGRHLQSGGGSSKYGRVKGWHLNFKRATTSSDPNDDSLDTRELRNCLTANGSGPACLNASGTTPNSTSRAPNSTALVLAPGNATNIGRSTSAAPTATPKTVASASERLGWKIGLIAPLVVILLVVGLLVRNILVKRQQTRQHREEVNTPHQLGGEQPQQAEREKQQTNNGSRDVDDNFQIQEILKSPVKARRKDSSHHKFNQEILGLETGTRKIHVKLADEADPPPRKSSVVSRFSLRSFSVRPPMDMSVFQARADPPLDTFQLELKHRARLSHAE